MPQGHVVPQFKSYGCLRALYKDPLANCGLALDISRDLHSYLANCATTLGIVNKALSKHLCLCLNHKNLWTCLEHGSLHKHRWTFVAMQQVFLWGNKFENLGLSCYFLFWVVVCFWSGDGFPSQKTKMCSIEINRLSMVSKATQSPSKIAKYILHRRV